MFSQFPLSGIKKKSHAFIVTILILTCLRRHFGVIKNKMGIQDDPEKECIFTANKLNAHSLSNPKTLFPFILPIPQPDILAFGMLSKSIATDLDEIPLKFIKHILPLILPFITHIYNTFLRTSMFPVPFALSLL
jgi:hypothetical protein